MKYLLILILTLSLNYNAGAQKTYTASKDEETGMPVFKGRISMTDLQEEPAFTWLKRGEAAYTPDSNAITQLRKELPAYTIVVLMGTWCDDSHLLIPRLSKTLQAAGFPMKQLVMYGADRAKQTGGIENKIYDLKRVPTIIVYKGNMETGRIVESARHNIETDLVQIIQKHADKN